MTTKKELIEGYYREIKSVMPVGLSYKEALGHQQLRVANDIAEQIKALVWETTQEPLSDEDKEKIIQGLRELISVKEANNANYLLLINHITTQLKKE